MTEEDKTLSTKEPLLVIRTADGELKSRDLQKMRMKDEIFSNKKSDLEEHLVIPNSENIEITVWKNRKIYLKRSLIPLRVALFLWFASGYICLPFFSLMLTYKGLTLTDFSTVFSIIFLLQFTVAYICGIIADKLGDSKPVLLFLMLGTICVLIGLLLSPNVTDKSLSEHHTNVTCFNNLNCDISDSKYCEPICFTNNTDYFAVEVQNRNISDASSKELDVLNKNGTREATFYANDTLNFCYEICSCLDDFEKNCVSTSKAGFKILYAVLILCFFSLWSTSYRFLDFASLNVAKENNSHFGNERFYGYLGAFTATLFCNFALNIDKSETKSYYNNVFWFAVALYTMAVISACNIRTVMLPPGMNLSRKSLKLFTDIEIVTLILIAFVGGTACTFGNFFCLLFLDSLNASKIVIGFHIMSSPFFSFPMYLTSKWWLKKLRRTTIVIISLLSYAIHAISYSFLYHPWIALIIEMTNGFSNHMFWISTVVYCNEIAPEGFAATLNAVVGTFHFGIGRSVSVSVGGYLMSTFGARTTFRILAGFCVLSAVLYLASIYLRHLISKSSSEKRSKHPEEMKSMKENEF